MSHKSWLTTGLALAFATLLGYIDLNSKEVQLPLACLLLFSFTLGVCQPKAAWRWGLIMGLSIPVSYFVAFALNLRAVDAPRYPITLVVLVTPALIVAYAGAYASKLSLPSESQAL